ncbi:MAG: hypothetical protein ACTHN5_02440 [Phycisphaerae bacterium]
MAVKVQCTKCNATLDLDEGFRGGVCRCNCGALLQVPRSSTEGAAKVRPAAPTPLQPRPAAHASTAVAPLSDPRSTPLSNISGSGLPRPAPVAHTPKKKKHPAPPAEPPQQTIPAGQTLPRHLTQIHRNTLLFRVAIALGILIVIVVLLLVALNFLR